MQKQRKTADVLTDLLRTMAATVINYYPDVGRTATTVEGLIGGTAVFPGGAGLWRGEQDGGALPELFPDCPVMFVGHNFDSEEAYRRSLARRGEVGGQFWQRLLMMLRFAGLQPSECFFTNVLMGTKPGSATGKMPSVPGYREQCAAYLLEQALIVKPRAVVAVGAEANRFVFRLQQEHTTIKHPSAREFSPLVTREERLRGQGERIRKMLDRVDDQSR